MTLSEKRYRRSQPRTTSELEITPVADDQLALDPSSRPTSPDPVTRAHRDTGQIQLALTRPTLHAICADHQIRALGRDVGSNQNPRRSAGIELARAITNVTVREI